MGFDRAKERERQILREISTCVHFNGVITIPVVMDSPDRKACKAGVVYHDQFGDGPGCFKSIPCTKRDTEKSCPKREYPTREQAELEVDESNALLQKHLSVIEKAHLHARSAGLGIGKGGRGELPCPSGCGGALRYSVAGVNGHMHGACSTSGCVSWME